MIHILTPCHRPENLDNISKTIPKECNWIIVFDSMVDNPPVVDGAVCMNSNMTGGFGSHNRNYAFDNFPFEDNDWIFWLDSDNIVHPSWYDRVKEFVDSDDDVCMVTWNQVNRNLDIRLSATTEPMVGGIDSASFMCKWKYVKDIRCTDSYFHDGEYAVACAERGKVIAIQENLSYYNYL